MILYFIFRNVTFRNTNTHTHTCIHTPEKFFILQNLHFYSSGESQLSYNCISYPVRHCYFSSDLGPILVTSSAPDLAPSTAFNVFSLFGGWKAHD